jgi:hypothetical protein
VRIAFSSGDWTGAFDMAAAALKARRKQASFIPTPMLFAACLSGLFAGRTEEATPYCLATGAYAPVESKLISAELAAARGDIDEARAEVEASRAIGAMSAAYQSQQLRIEAFIAAREGDMDGAQLLLWRHLDMLKGQPDEKSRRATALRLFATWMIERAARERACAPLSEARALYEAVGGRAGVEAVDALRGQAGCAGAPA